MCLQYLRFFEINVAQTFFDYSGILEFEMFSKSMVFETYKFVKRFKENFCVSFQKNFIVRFLNLNFICKQLNAEVPNQIHSSKLLVRKISELLKNLPGGNF